MKWIIDDIRSAMTALSRTHTWIVLAMISGFFLLAVATFNFALRYDAVLRTIKHSMSSCREMTNVPIIFLFGGMIFFLLSSAVALGEAHQYFHYREAGSNRQAAQAKVHGFGWAVFAVLIAVGGLTFFQTNCR